MIQTKDIMTASVVTTAPEASVQEMAQILLERFGVAVPVAGADNRILGVLNQGDLPRRTMAADRNAG
jgi:CBS-domain-containing membrane protein